MSWGLPKQPGMTFTDPTKNKFHMRQSLKFYNGYAFPETNIRGTGGTTTDVESNAFTNMDDTCMYDPSLTYGRVKQPAMPATIPHFVHYDKRCLKFSAFLKQSVFESQEEAYRVRAVDLVYFLEDDTMTVMEPRVRNSGLWQGRMVKRGKIPKNDLGDFYHWKDLNIRKDIPIFGKVFHTVSCDLFTSEYLASQGVELEPFEEMPEDPHLTKKRWRQGVHQLIRGPPTHERVDSLWRYLNYDGKVLRFDCVWDDRVSENGGLREHRLLYFLQDDTVSVKEIHDGRSGLDPFPLMLKRTKLPRNWKERPLAFPSIFLEKSPAEVSEYYTPRDMIVGNTVFVLGRRFLIYDCDPYTRQYYKTALNVEQPARIKVHEDARREHVKVLPPHIGIGTAEDAIGSCYSLLPKPPKKDVIKFILNANKNLRYLCELEYIHPEDEGRRFVLSYGLADGAIRIGEVPRRNSGIMEGTFMARAMLQTPESDPNFPTYYTPDRFYIGGTVHVRKHRFKIIGCDLFVYRYMCANPDKFPKDIVDNVRNYHLLEGNLKDDLKDAIDDEEDRLRNERLAALGSSAVAEPSPMERCLAALGVVEGSAAPPRPPTPPPTTANISYDDCLKHVRASSATCDDLKPLKGILKTGEARDEHQKVVCFNAPAAPDRESDQQAEMAPADGFCDQLRDLEREERRASGVCAYPPVPSYQARYDAAAEVGGKGEPVHDQDLDCTQIEDYVIPERNTAVPAVKAH